MMLLLLLCLPFCGSACEVEEYILGELSAVVSSRWTATHKTFCSWEKRIPPGYSIRVSPGESIIPGTGGGDCSGWRLEVLDASVAPPVVQYRACGAHFEPIERPWGAVMIRFHQPTSPVAPRSVMRVEWQLVPHDSGCEGYVCPFSRRCIRQQLVCNNRPDCVTTSVYDFGDEARCPGHDGRSSWRVVQSPFTADWASSVVAASAALVAIGIVLAALTLIVHSRRRRPGSPGTDHPGFPSGVSRIFPSAGRWEINKGTAVVEL